MPNNRHFIAPQAPTTEAILILGENANTEDTMKQMRNITVSEIKINDLVLIGQDTVITVEALGKDGKHIQVAGIDPEGRQTMATAPGHMIALLILRTSELN